MSVIEFRNVSKFYSGIDHVQALHEVSFALEKGSFSSLVGPSGSGKTTLLNLAAGLDRASSGEVIIAGISLAKLSHQELSRFRRDHLGFIFQGYNLLPLLTAIENVEFTLLIRGEDRKVSRERAQDALNRVGLSEKANFFPRELSGGQQQRVAVARAVAAKPDLVLADEPTANLDTKTAMQLIELFENLNRDLGMTFLFSTHDHRLLDRQIHQIEMQDGSLK